MMAVSGKPDAVFLSKFFPRRKIIMAVGTVTKIIGILGITAAVMLLLISILGWLVWICGIRYLEKLEG